MATGASKATFRKRFFRTGMTILCSAFLGGSFAAEALRRKAQSNSLALNLMSLPSSHREMITTLENLEDAQLTPSTYISAAESLLPHVRKLKTNISTHHILRIQSASFLKKYHNALSQILNEKTDNDSIDIEEYSLHQRRRLSDMKLAFDFVNFKSSEVSDNITNIVKLNKIDYARMARDKKRLRVAFDEIYNINKQNKEKVSDDSLEEEERKQKDESREQLLEHEIMALYSNAPYLGEWNTFMKIGNALHEKYGKLERINTDNNDGIDFNDIYCIGKEIDIVDEIPTPMESNLKFDIKPIEYIAIKYNSHTFMDKNGNDIDDNDDNGSWFASTKKKNSLDKGWIQLNNDNYNDNIIDLRICRLGAVQKTISISKCVQRVQGPIFYDNTIKMRGSTTLMVPSKNENKDKVDTVIPNQVPLYKVNDFVEIKQIEEWDLMPIQVGNTNEFKGKITIRTEPLDSNDDSLPFQIEYDCILKLSDQVQDYY